MEGTTLREISPNFSARSIKRDFAELKFSYSKAEVLVTYLINKSHAAVNEIEVVSDDCKTLIQVNKPINSQFKNKKEKKCHYPFSSFSHYMITLTCMTLVVINHHDYHSFNLA